MMAISKSLTNLPRILTGLLAFGIISGSFVTLANDIPVIDEPQPLVVPDGTIQDLRGIEEKNNSEWLAGSGGEEEGQATLNSVYEVEESAYNSQTEAINLTLDNKVGDTQRIIRRFPLTE